MPRKSNYRLPTGIRPLTGKAAEWLEEYLRTTKPDPEAQERQIKEDLEAIAQIVQRLGLKPSKSPD